MSEKLSRQGQEIATRLGALGQYFMAKPCHRRDLGLTVPVRCCGSVTFWLMDPATDHAVFVIYLQDVKKNIFLN